MPVVNVANIIVENAIMKLCQKIKPQLYEIFEPTDNCKSLTNTDLTQEH